VIVVVDGACGHIALEDAENLKALSVHLRHCDATNAQLGDVGHLDGEHAWLDIAQLRALSPLADDPEWNTGFDATMAYAGSKGWLDESGTKVRAHLD
jgi:hypothetical protein